MQMDIYDEAIVVFAIRFAKMSENSMLKNNNRFGCGNITVSFRNNLDARHPFRNLVGFFSSQASLKAR
jgi:hypothetical protein